MEVPYPSQEDIDVEVTDPSPDPIDREVPDLTLKADNMGNIEVMDNEGMEYFIKWPP